MANAETEYRDAIRNMGPEEIGKIEKDPLVLSGDSSLVQHAKKCYKAFLDESNGVILRKTSKAGSQFQTT